jgi:hypothetical protein
MRHTKPASTEGSLQSGLPTTTPSVGNSRAQTERGTGRDVVEAADPGDRTEPSEPGHLLKRAERHSNARETLIAIQLASNNVEPNAHQVMHARPDVFQRRA